MWSIPEKPGRQFFQNVKEKNEKPNFLPPLKLYETNAMRITR